MSSEHTSKAKPKPAAKTRKDRLKAALKANMSRRKAQARARAQSANNPESAATD